jgi:hypothetical protein
MSLAPLRGRLREGTSGVDRSQAALSHWGKRPRKGDWSDLSTRACGPRNIMKMFLGRMQNGTGSERRDPSHSG